MMVDEFRTTKRCPDCECCKSKEEEPRGNMYQPKGHKTYTDRNGVVRRKRVHGLSQCGLCHRLWSRDYAATINIGRVFTELYLNNKRPDYLSRTTANA